MLETSAVANPCVPVENSSAVFVAVPATIIGATITFPFLSETAELVPLASTAAAGQRPSARTNPVKRTHRLPYGHRRSTQRMPSSIGHLRSSPRSEPLHRSPPAARHSRPQSSTQFA